MAGGLTPVKRRRPVIKPEESGGQAAALEVVSADADVGGNSADSVATTNEQNDDAWSSKVVFIFASLSTTLGMGNIWRFPFLVYEHGGGAFFVPYLICLCVLSLPVLTLEMSIGQRSGGAHPKAFGSINSRGRAPGFGVACIAFILVFYYGLLVNWAVMYFAFSWKKPMPWSFDFAQLDQCASMTTVDSCEFMESCSWNDVAASCGKDVLKKARAFFTDYCNSPSDLTGAVKHGLIAISLPMSLICALIWIGIYLTICWGTRIMGYILYITTVLPTVLVFVLLIIGLTRTGMKDGLKLYLGTWDFTKLQNSDVWTHSAGQVIFSLSCACGTQSAYAAKHDKPSNYFVDALIVCVTDTMYSIICGFVVFSFAGSLANAAGVKIQDLELKGPTLAYMTYPTGVAELGYPGGNIVCVVFFFTVFLLAFTTAVSDTIGGISFFDCCKVQKHLSYNAITAIMCCVLFILETMFLCTAAGHQILEAVDNLLNNFCLVVAICLECITAGYGLYYELQEKQIGRKACVTLPCSIFPPMVVGTLVGFAASGVARIVVPVICGAVAIAGIIASIVFAIQDDQQPNMGTGTKLWWLFLGNLEVYRENDLNIASKGWSKAPLYWTLCIKYVAPMAAILLVGSFIVKKENVIQYENYPNAVLTVGWFWTLVFIIVVLLGAFYPQAYDYFLSFDEEEYEYEICHPHYRGEKYATLEDVRADRFR